MTVTINSINRISSEAVQIKYSSDLSNPVFFIYIDGELYDTTEAASAIIRINPGESPVISIIDSLIPGEIPAYYPKYAALTWWYLNGAVEYRIEEYIGSAWVVRDTIPENGKGYYLWKSRVLEDCVSHSFRVIPVDEKGNDGTAQEFEILMVRIPDEPQCEFSYSAVTGELTLENI